MRNCAAHIGWTLSVSRKRESLGEQIVVAVLLLSASTGPVLAGVDQSMTLPPDQFYNHGSPRGQEFTPALNAVSFVDMLFKDNDSGAGTGANFHVAIRSSTIQGATLGTSLTSFVPDNLNNAGGTTYTHFTFASPVTLTPGSLYVIQVVFESGDFTNIVMGVKTTNSYSGGRAIDDGGVVASNDYVFVEGTPEPTTLLLSLGCAALLVFSGRRSRPFSARIH